MALRRARREKAARSALEEASATCRPTRSRRPPWTRPPSSGSSSHSSRTGGRSRPTISSSRSCRKAIRPAAEDRIWAADELASRIQALGYHRALAARGRCSDRLALDERLCAAIRGGARVVLLADAPMELQPIFPHWQAARVVRRSGAMWQGDWISFLVAAA